MSPGLRYLTPLKRKTMDDDFSWVPSDKSGLVYWFNAGSISGVSNGDPVSSWPDDSEELGDVTNTGSNRPIYVSSAIGGRPGVGFTASSSQFLRIDNTQVNNWATDAPLSAIAVFRSNALDGNGFRCVHGFATNSGTSSSGSQRRGFAILLPFGTNTTGYGDFYTGVLDNPASAGIKADADPNENTALIINYNGSGATNTSNWAMFNNNSPLSLSAGSNGGISALHCFVGAWTGSGTATFFFDGVICELFGYDSQCSAGEIEEIAGYIQQKYGIAQAGP